MIYIYKLFIILPTVGHLSHKDIYKKSTFNIKNTVNNEKI